MCTHGAYTGDKVVLSDEDRKMVATLVDRSVVIQGAYNKCTDEESKRKLAMKYHTAGPGSVEVAGGPHLRLLPASI